MGAPTLNLQRNEFQQDSRGDLRGVSSACLHSSPLTSATVIQASRWRALHGQHEWGKMNTAELSKTAVTCKSFDLAAGAFVVLPPDYCTKSSWVSVRQHSCDSSHGSGFSPSATATSCACPRIPWTRPPKTAYTSGVLKPFVCAQDRMVIPRARNCAFTSDGCRWRGRLNMLQSYHVR